MTSSRSRLPSSPAPAPTRNGLHCAVEDEGRSVLGAPIGTQWDALSSIIGSLIETLGDPEEAGEAGRTAYGSSHIRFSALDMDMFGFSSTDAPMIVLCTRCSRTVKVSRLSFHLRHCGANSQSVSHKRKLMQSNERISDSHGAGGPTKKHKINETAPKDDQMVFDGDYPSKASNKRADSATTSRTNRRGKLQDKGDSKEKAKQNKDKAKHSTKQEKTTPDQSKADSHAQGSIGALCRRALQSMPSPLARRIYTRRNRFRSIIFHLVSISSESHSSHLLLSAGSMLTTYTGLSGPTALHKSADVEDSDNKLTTTRLAQSQTTQYTQPAHPPQNGSSTPYTGYNVPSKPTTTTTAQQHPIPQHVLSHYMGASPKNADLQPLARSAVPVSAAE